MNDDWFETFLSFLLFFFNFYSNIFIEYFFYFLFLFVFACLIYQIYQVKRLATWLTSGETSKSPQVNGIWGGIYQRIVSIKKSDKRRKKRLGEIIKEFRQLTAALPYAAVVLGDQDEIEWINKVARQTFGLKKSDKGKCLVDLIADPQLSDYLQQSENKLPVVLVSPIDSHVILEYKVVEYGVGLRLLLAQDVTKVKQVERMRKDFVANVSHELRTPLTVLKGYLETLQEFDDGHNPLTISSLNQMQAQTERMEYLVSDLLLLTRLETQEIKAGFVDIKLMLIDICHESNSLQEAQGRIVLTLESDTGLVGDEQELRSAFTNLIINAIKYSPVDCPVQVRWSETKKTLLLEVRDFGEGIANEEIPRITERFYRVDRQRSRKLKGTGLGLAIVKHVLVRHNALLEIDSQLGEGSYFRCVFPQKKPVKASG